MERCLAVYFDWLYIVHTESKCTGAPKNLLCLDFLQQSLHNSMNDWLMPTLKDIADRKVILTRNQET